MKKETYLGAGLLLLSAMSFAAGADSTATPVAAAKSPFTFTGYIDSYYFGNANNPKGATNLGQSGAERAFDQRANTIGIGLVQTKFGYSNAKSDVVVDLTFGPNADLGNYGNSPTQTSSLGVSHRGTGAAFFSGISIKQAYFNYKATDKLTFTAGQFGTHIGYEVIDAPINYNYSLSNLFNNGPFYHIGVKANYAFTDKLALMVGVVNGVDALYDNNKQKGFISQFFINPAKGWNIYLNYIGSNEATLVTKSRLNTSQDSLINTKNALYQLFDITTGYQITDKFYMGLNAAYGMQSGDYQGNGNPSIAIQRTATNGTKDSTKTWSGIALYSNYAFTDKYSLGIRAEYFDNTSGVRNVRNTLAQNSSLATNKSYVGGSNKYGGTSVTSITITGNITLADGHLLLKPEVRMDIYEKKAFSGLDRDNIQQFLDSKGNYTNNSQTTYGAALVYKF